MATVKDLFRRTQAMIDDNLNNADMIDWFNQAQDNIGDLLYLPTLQTVTRDIVSGNFLVPANCNGELKILEPAGISVYSIYDNTLYFDGSDDVALTQIKITYNRVPTIITSNPDLIPDIPERFHDVYIFYASMMAMAVEEEPERYAMYEKDYLRARGQLQKYMGKIRPKPESWKVVR